MSNDRLWLLIDADDTLWENSVYFERAFEEFAAFLDHPEMTPPEVREVLDAIEIENIRVNGYGAANFGRNMQNCFRRLARREFSDPDLETVAEIAAGIRRRPMELLDGVAETLEHLSGRHHLTLFSKGSADEQLDKFKRSGLESHFDDCRIVPEKNVGAYREMVEEGERRHERTWMIGNSPKSDIHPALDAGLGAVLVPHEFTWSLEVSELPAPSERFRVVERFADLRRIF